MPRGMDLCPRNVLTPRVGEILYRLFSVAGLSGKWSQGNFDGDYFIDVPAFVDIGDENV